MALPLVKKIWEYGTSVTVDTAWQRIKPLDFLITYGSIICGYSNFSQSFETFESYNLKHVSSLNFGLKVLALAVVDEEILVVTASEILILDRQFQVLRKIANSLAIVAATSYDGAYFLSDKLGGTYLLKDGRIRPHKKFLLDSTSRAQSMCHCSLTNILVLVSPRDNKVYIFKGDKRITCLGGEYDHLSGELPLHYPLSASIFNGKIYISNANKNNILIFDYDSSRLSKHPSYANDQQEYLFSRPNFIVFSDDGSMLVSDSKNCNLLKLDDHFRLRASLNKRHLEYRALNLPRAVKRLDLNRLLVVDSHNNRILELTYDPAGLVQAETLVNIPWPRDITLTAENGYSCLTSLDAHMHHLVLDQGLMKKSPMPCMELNSTLKDPHQFVFRGRHQWLLVDTGNDRLILNLLGVRSDICIVNARPLSDPHSADFIGESDIIIADTGNSRILVSSGRLSEWQEVTSYFIDGEQRAFNEPRYVKSLNNTYLVIDTGSKSVYCFDKDFNALWVYGDASYAHDTMDIWRSSVLHDARHVEPLDENRFVISDTGNSRLVAIEVQTWPSGHGDALHHSIN